MLFFPEDDVEVFTVPRTYRTTEIPVPGAAKRSSDLLVQECVEGFMADWHSIKRKLVLFFENAFILYCLTRHGSFYGSDGHIEQDDQLKDLPSHEYEVDMDKQGVHNEYKGSKMSMLSNASAG